jgi:hypothetical protein
LNDIINRIVNIFKSFLSVIHHEGTKSTKADLMEVNRGGTETQCAEGFKGRLAMHFLQGIYFSNTITLQSAISLYEMFEAPASLASFLKSSLINSG